MSHSIYPSYNGQFVPVDAKGVYTAKSNLDFLARPATKVTTAMGHRIRHGLYIGLQGVGHFAQGVGGTGVQRLGGLFSNENWGVNMSPPSGSTTQPFQTPRTLLGNMETDIIHDFEIPFNRRVIVMVPPVANCISFSVGDSHYSDNSSFVNFGVYVSFPNGTTFIDTTGDGEGPVSYCVTLPWHIDNMDNRSFMQSPFSEFGQVNWSQLRGWHLRTGTNQWAWAPRESLWMGSGARPSHKGIDIFCPAGTTLVAPTDCLYRWYVNVPGLGNVAHFKFRYNNEDVSLSYAHCTSSLHPDNTLLGIGELAATSGCSGNADQVLCGHDLPNGGRADHVHVVYSTNGQLDPNYYDDPLKILRWCLAA